MSRDKQKEIQAEIEKVDEEIKRNIEENALLHKKKAKLKRDKWEENE